MVSGRSWRSSWSRLESAGSCTLFRTEFVPLGFIFRNFHRDNMRSGLTIFCGPCYVRMLLAEVAQLVEQTIRNRQVAGSTPALGSNSLINLARSSREFLR